MLPWRWTGGGQRWSVWPGSRPPMSAQHSPEANAQPPMDVSLRGPKEAREAQMSVY